MYIRKYNKMNKWIKIGNRWLRTSRIVEIRPTTVSSGKELSHIIYMLTDTKTVDYHADISNEDLIEKLNELEKKEN
jgi:hypothetical protein